MTIKEVSGKILRKFIKKTFSFWQMLGFHITSIHFYEPIPDTRKLKDNLWQKHSQLIGININEKKQLELLSLFISKFKKEYKIFPKNGTHIQVPYQYYVNNGGFESVDGEILYCMIRYFKPKRIIEIGSGNSTYLSAQAILKNKEEDKIDCELIAIEPYPNKILEKGFPGLSKLIKKEIQDVGLSIFDQLKKDDILFIDSSHVLKIGGDVQYEYLEILPRLNKNVIVHIHDIFLPVEYPKKWILKNNLFWTEQYLLQTFLTFNNTFEVLWAGSYMHIKNLELLKKAFNSYNPKVTWPGSFWIRKKV